MKGQGSSQGKFLWSAGLIQIVMIGVYWLLVRYNDHAHPFKHHHDQQHEEHIPFNDVYPLGVDVVMMLLGGFGFLMTFLKKYGLSAIGFTMIITVIVTQFSIIVFGLLKMGDEFVIKIGFVDVIEAGLVGGAVLISFGAIIGKVNPLQLMFMSLVEATFCVINLYVGYSVLGVVDVGGSIFIHTFGAYFGLAVSFCLRWLRIS